jgi:nicotinamidase-related amidase
MTVNDIVGADTEQRYREQGWGEHRVGFGQRPALLVVDMQYDFVDPDSPSTCAPIAQERLPDIQRLLSHSRAAGIPVFFSQGLVHPTLVDVGLWKGWAHRTGKCQIEGTRGAEIVAELAPRPEEHVVQKRRPSAFFRTDLEVFLSGLHVDTLILAGSSTSGCVRATAVDAFSRDLRTMIVRECVIDRTAELSERNLFDLHAKYADAVSLDETLAYLATVAAPTTASARPSRA